MPAVCAYPIEEVELAAFSKLTWTTPLHHKSRRKLVRTVPPLVEVWRPYAHADCECNAVTSAKHRVLAKNPIPTDAAVKSVRKVAKRMARKFGVIEPWTFEQVLDIYTGPKKTRYANAVESLKSRGLNPSDGYVTAFIKGEKLNPIKKNPPPRMIQYRNARYGISLARYLKPIEKALYRIRVGTTNLPAMAKGLNSRERAELFQEKWKAFDAPVCVSLDCSKWDRHLHADMLQIELDFYEKLIGQDRELKWLLQQQLRNKCFAGPASREWAVKYKVSGNRMSGDMNTAVGNCLMMVLFVVTAMDELKIRKWDIMDDGDDCLLLVERGHLSQIVKQLPIIFETFGQELKLEKIAFEQEDVIFCQTKLVKLSTGDRFVSDWKKILACSTSGIRYWDNPRIVPDMLYAVGTCLFAANFGVPIIQRYALRLIELSSGKLPRCWKMMYDEQVKLERDKRMWGGEVGTHEMPISMDDRYSFERTYGVIVERQLEIEHYLSTWNPNFTLYRQEGAEWDHTWQDWTSPDLVHMK